MVAILILIEVFPLGRVVCHMMLAGAGRGAAQRLDNVRHIVSGATRSTEDASRNQTKVEAHGQSPGPKLHSVVSNSDRDSNGEHATVRLTGP